MNEQLKTWLESSLNFPEVVQAESTNRCNARCSICPVNTKTTKERMDMPRITFDKIVNDCIGKPVKEFLLHQNGEPLLIGAAVLADRVKYAKERLPQAQVGFFSNGSLMTEDATEIMLKDCPPDLVVFSVDGGNQDTYERIRIGLKYNEVVENIRNFGKRRMELGHHKMRVIVQCVVNKTNEGSRNELAGRFQDCGITSVGMTGMVNYAGAIDTADNLHEFQNKVGMKTNPCWRLYTNMVVQSDGRVQMCCFTWNSDVIVGNVLEQSLQEIWQGKEMTRLRAMHEAGKQAELVLCKDCDYMEWFKAPGWYFNGIGG